VQEEHPPDEIADLAEHARTAWVELTGPDGYLPILLLLFAAVAAGLLVGDSPVGGAATGLLGGGALLVTVYRSTRRPQVRRITLVLVAGVMGLALVRSSLSPTGSAEAGWISLVAYLVVVAAALPLVLVRALRHRRVTMNTVCATISAYLLIGMFFSGVYRLHERLAPPFFTQTTGPTSGEFTYFSFMTLTTVGFGDFTPGSDPARAWVALEATTGQVFVITALAQVVSLLGAERPRPRRPGPGD
jgi:hypothetical protein